MGPPRGLLRNLWGSQAAGFPSGGAPQRRGYQTEALPAREAPEWAPAYLRRMLSIFFPRASSSTSLSM